MKQSQICDLWNACLNQDDWEQINVTTILNQEQDIMIQIDFVTQFTIIFNSTNPDKFWIERIPRKLELDNQLELFYVFSKNYGKKI
jgi:hypothetical protein